MTLLIRIIAMFIVYSIGRYLTEKYGENGWSSGSCNTGVVAMATWQLLTMIFGGL